MTKICKCGHLKKAHHLNLQHLIDLETACTCKKFEAQDEVPKEVVDDFIKKGLKKLKPKNHSQQDSSLNNEIALNGHQIEQRGTFNLNEEIENLFFQGKLRECFNITLKAHLIRIHKEFIKRLKEEIMKEHPLSIIAQYDVIDKLSGSSFK